MTDKARRETVISILSQTYPNAHIVLSYSSPWELLVAVVLSAQCTDLVVNRVTEKLFKIYPDFRSYIDADLPEFEKHIKSTGFYHNKAKNILAAARLIQNKFKGEVPKTMSDLLSVPGVARKTANVILGNAYGVVEGVAVDTHVIRLSQRLRLVPMDKIGGKNKVFICKTAGGGFRGKDGKETTTASLPARFAESRRAGRDPLIDYIKDARPEKIESELMKVIPKKLWFLFTYQLIDHGRAICKAQNPICSVCPLASYCPAKRN